MNKEQSFLLDLIKQSQFDSTSSISINSINIEALYIEASDQTVLGLITPELIHVINDDKLNQMMLYQKAAFIRYCHAEETLIDLLTKQSIPFVILKGNAAAIYYRDPSRRMMGDIDFLVPQNFYYETRKILDNHGYINIHEDGRHVTYKKDGYLFELHPNFNHDEKKYDDYLTKGILNCTKAFVFDHEFPILPELENGLVLLEHIRSHLKLAIGLRQIVDWMMYVYNVLDDEFWHSQFQNAARNMGLEKLAVVVTRTCQIYLGLTEKITWCRFCDEHYCKQLMECVLLSGNFGRKNGDGNYIETVSTKIKQKGLLRWLQHAGEYNWKAYHKHQWLKPFCWFYQIFRYAKQGIKSGRNRKQLKGDLDRSRERYELLKKLGID